MAGSLIRVPVFIIFTMRPTPPGEYQERRYHMIRFIIVCILNGILFGILDGGIHGNPYARKMFEVYKPIAKTSINIPAGLFIDLIYGFTIGLLFVVLYKSLPGDTGIIKGISFALILWFFRVVMGVISSWMMFTIPAQTLLYIAVTGLLEMVVLGIVYGVFLKPFRM